MQPKAINTIKTNQVKQKKTQDKRHKTQDQIPIGTKVTIRSCKMEGKLPNKFNGIFTVSGTIKKGNYWLTISLKRVLPNSFNSPRLKIVDKDAISEIDPKIEAIRDRRIKRGGRIEYLVKWKGQDETKCTWLPETQKSTLTTYQCTRRTKTHIMSGGYI